MRVCILTKGEPWAWTRHYIAAFRTCGHDVLTVGPNATREELISLHLEYLYETFTPNDIESRLEPDVVLAELLPAQWLPDLIVAISVEGMPLCPIMDGLRCPSIYISTDTWQSPRDYLDAIAYDFVFVAQREHVPRMQALGARNVSWLPLGCTPAIHYPCPQEPVADISFVGSIALPIHQERYDLLRQIEANFRVLARSCLYGEELCRLCGSTKLTFNHSAVRDLNMRVFEALAMGAPLLTNRDSAVNGLLDLFEEDMHLIVYDTPAELLAKARRYIDDDAARRRVAHAGYTEVLARHTYCHRVETMVGVVSKCVPGFGRSWAPRCQEHPIVNQMPAGPESVLDFGMGLASVTDNLRQRGVRQLTAIGEAASRASGYDHVLEWRADLACPKDVDVAVVRNVCALPASLDECLRVAHTALRGGGSLLVQLQINELSALDIPLDAEAMRLWLLKYDFLFQRAHLEGDAATGPVSSCILCARKRTRKLRDVIDETFSNLTPNCASVHEAICRWCENYPSGI
ncbi:MAG: glycosyltransferase [Candidatus Hydrogenedentes bacterium]|nr:glycosyltransferase [Candidatus Hydrogenedentota bacterium]